VGLDRGCQDPPWLRPCLRADSCEPWEGNRRKGAFKRGTCARHPLHNGVVPRRSFWTDATNRTQQGHHAEAKRPVAKSLWTLVIISLRHQNQNGKLMKMKWKHVTNYSFQKKRQQSQANVNNAHVDTTALCPPYWTGGPQDPPWLRPCLKSALYRRLYNRSCRTGDKAGCQTCATRT